MTAEEALSAAHLTEWNVRKAPLTALTEDGVLEVPNGFATVRTNPISGSTEVLGMVGGSYTPIQNEEHADLLNALIDESSARFETAGALRNGRDVFLSMKFPETMLIGGQDAVDIYLTALNSHDGTSSFRFLLTPIRVVCANTQAAAIAQAKSEFRIRHTPNASSAIIEARAALGMTHKYLEGFQQEANRMIDTAITDQKFRDILNREFGTLEAITERQKTNRAARVDEVFEIYQTASTCSDVKGTRWGAYQAVTQWLDHQMPTLRAVDTSTARATRTVLSLPLRQSKERVFEALVG
jgi:phage/plasmid-like protein (TIGR03299 family)